MAKARIGHFVEAQVLEALEVDYVDESEVLTPADEAHHIDKWRFKVPFVCGATNLGEALRRIAEGAAMIRSKGEAGTATWSRRCVHIRLITGEIRRLGSLSQTELPTAAKELGAPLGWSRTWRSGAGSRSCCSAPAGSRRPRNARAHDAARSGGQLRRLRHLQVVRPRAPRRAIVEATNPLRRSRARCRRVGELGEAMPGIEIGTLESDGGLLQHRGW